MKKIFLVLTVLSSVLFSIYFFGLNTLHPTHIDWLMENGDTAIHYVGWETYRGQPWSFPIGKNPALFAPHYTSTVFTDSIPILAAFFKIFSHWLPERFQYFGLWFALCFLLQGVLTYSICSRLKLSPLSSFLCSLLLMISPVLIFRLIHPSLCAHWMILAFFIFYLQALESLPKKAFFVKLYLLNAFFIGVHAYLATMGLVFSMAVLFSLYHQKKISLHRLGTHFSILLSVFIGFTFLYGYWIPVSIGDSGVQVGEYSADFLSLFNSYDTSAFFSKIRSIPNSFEGYAYLGLGGIFLFLIFLCFSKKSFSSLQNDLRSWRPWIAVSVFMALYSLSTRVHFGGNLIVDLKPIYYGLQPLFETFRATGRFIWPFYYLALLLISISVFRTFRPQWGYGIFILALVLQGMDLHPWISSRSDSYHRQISWDQTDLDSDFVFQNEFQTLAWVPPLHCPDFEPMLPRQTLSAFTQLGTLAARHQLQMNTGLAARYPNQEIAKYCGSFLKKVENKIFAPDTLYAVFPHYADLFKDQTCIPQKGFQICKTRN